ncbi:MAG: sensor histidine kinase [Eisenbergiella sp.]
MCCRYPFLNCEYEIDESLLDVEMPNFILQPLVENSVMHGLRGVGYRGTVRLSVSRDETDGENIVIRIYDNGAGFSPGTRSLLENVLQNAGDDTCETGTEEMHIGIVNVQRRLKMFYPDTAGLSYQDNPEGGVTVTLIIKSNVEREGLK